MIRGGEVGKFMCGCKSGACFLCVHNIDASEPHSSESLNELLRARLSRRCMIWLLPHLLPSPLSLFLSLAVSCRSTLLTRGEREWVEEEPNHAVARKPGPL